MSAREAILAEIVAHPESDDLRQVFADAISSEDPDWSTHIMESMSSDWLIARRDPSDELEVRIRSSLGRLARFSGGIERGFVSSVEMTPQDFVEHGEQILQAAPILRVNLSGPDGYQTDWNTWLPNVLQCHALKRVRLLSIGVGSIDFGTMCQLIRSPNIDRLTKLEVDASMCGKPELEPEMWELLFESSVFRGMIDWGLGTHLPVGDSVRERERPDSDYYTVTTYVPMRLEDRALEEKYGYIPRLHAGNWGATVLDVLRGVKPDFPVGARPIPEMYVVPPPLVEKVHGLDF